MRRILFSLGLLFMLALWSASVFSADRYITASGGSGDACTNNAPCTPNTGIEQLKPGDTLRLKDKGGVYNEIGNDEGRGTSDIVGGTSDSNRTFIRPAPGESPTVRTMMLRNQPWVTVDGENRLVVDGNYSSDVGVIFLGHHVTLKNFEIKNQRNHGVLGCDEKKTGEGACRYEHLKIHNIGGTSFDKSTCFGNGMCHGLYIVAPNLVVDGCDIYDIWDGKGVHPNVGGLSTTGMVVRNNRVHNTEDGILLYGGDKFQVYNNLVYNNRYQGIQKYGGSGHLIAFNTVYNNGGDGIQSSGSLVTNNISWNNGNNITSGGTLTHNVTENPGFMRASGGDFTIGLAGSPAVGAGIKMDQISTDITGARREDPPTVGAYAFASEGGGPPPATSTAPPTDLRVNGSTEGAVVGKTCTITWQPSSSPNLKEYRLYLAKDTGDQDPNQVAATIAAPKRTATCADLGLEKDGAYYLAAAAVTQAGVASDLSNEVPFVRNTTIIVPPQPQVDLEPPVITIVEPKADEPVTPSSTVMIKVEATDNVSITRLALTINQKSLCVLFTAPFQCQWKVPAQAGQRYRVNAQAMDQSGNNAFVQREVVAK